MKLHAEHHEKDPARTFLKGSIIVVSVGLVGLLAVIAVEVVPKLKLGGREPVIGLRGESDQYTSESFTVGDEWEIEYEGELMLYATREDGTVKFVDCWGSRGRQKMFGAGTYTITAVCVNNGFRVTVYSD